MINEILKIHKRLVYNQLIRTVFLIQVKLQHPEIYGIWAYMHEHSADQPSIADIVFKQTEWVSKRKARRQARKPGIKL